MRIRLTLALLAIVTVLPAMAQNGNNAYDEYRRRKQAELDGYLNRRHQQVADYQERKHRELEEYLQRRGQEFADRMGGQWTKRNQEKPLPPPTKPDPVEPPVLPKDEEERPHQPVAVPQPEVKPAVIPAPQVPEPLPLPDPEPRKEDVMQVDLFGMPLDVAMTSDLRFSLKSLKPADIKATTLALGDSRYTPMIEDFARYCDDLHLNGWARLCLSRAIANRLQGEGSNEAAVLQAYLMAMLGYDVQPVSINDRRLGVMFASNLVLCGLSYIDIDGRHFYITEDLPNGTLVTPPTGRGEGGTCAIDFDHAADMLLATDRSEPRVFQSEKDAAARVNVSVNRSLMRYYMSLPSFQDIAFYARQPFEPTLAQQLLPTLRGLTASLSERDAANLLIHFVQTAFSYMTDEEQFGMEKPFFKEELFGHRYSDCEDRAILYAGLVQTLLGLDVVLLHYPGHMCTAVLFNEDVSGDYTVIDGKRYVICDPCFIAADIGRCMPQFVDVKPEALRIR